MLWHKTRILTTVLSLFVLSFNLLAQNTPTDFLLSNLSFLQNSSCQININRSTVCSGVLINTSGSNRKNYVMSAAHCVPDTSLITSLEITFGGQPPLNSGAYDGFKWSTTLGAEIVALDYQLDYILYEVVEVIPFNMSPFFLGWKSETSMPATGVTYHYAQLNTQQTALKRTSIAIGNYEFPEDYMQGLSAIPNAFWKVQDWTIGETSFGSSGTGLIDQEGNFLGGLTGGVTFTSGSSADYFYRFDLAYQHVTDQYVFTEIIDPANLGNVPGVFAYEWQKNRLYSQNAQEIRIENLSSGNSLKLNLDLNESTGIRGVYLTMEEISAGLGSSLSIELFNNDLLIQSETVSLISLTAYSENYIDFGKEVSAAGELEVLISSNTNQSTEFVGVPVISGNEAYDLFAVNELSEAEPRIGSLILGFLSDKRIHRLIDDFGVVGFPTVTSDFVFISPANEIALINIFDGNGRNINPSITERNGEYIVNVSSLLAGVYFIHVFDMDNRWSVLRVLKK